MFSHEQNCHLYCGGKAERREREREREREIHHLFFVGFLYATHICFMFIHTLGALRAYIMGYMLVGGGFFWFGFAYWKDT